MEEIIIKEGIKDRNKEEKDSKEIQLVRIQLLILEWEAAEDSRCK